MNLDKPLSENQCKVNYSALAATKSSFRRSLLLSMDETTVDQKAEHITVIDLGASAEGVFHPDEGL